MFGGEGDLCQLISFATSLLTALSIIISSFFLPVYDKTVLVIPKPGMKLSLTYQSQKVFQPFTSNLWVVVLAIIVSAALPSTTICVVLRSRNGSQKMKWKDLNTSKEEVDETKACLFTIIS